MVSIMNMEVAICWGVLAVICVVARVVYWRREREKNQSSRSHVKMRGGVPNIPRIPPVPPTPLIEQPLLYRHRTGPGGDTDQAVDKLLQHLEDDGKGSHPAGAIELATALQVVAEEHFNHDVPDDAESVVYELLREAARALQRHNEALEDIRASGNNEDRTVQ